jgi:hypothetical protein
VALAFAEADLKFKALKTKRWRILGELLGQLNRGQHPVAEGEIVVMMIRTADARHVETKIIDHPGFVTIAYLNKAGVSKTEESRGVQTAKRTKRGARKDVSGFVFMILFSKRILELLFRHARLAKQLQPRCDESKDDAAVCNMAGVRQCAGV